MKNDSSGLTYAGAGVDIASADATKAGMAKTLETSNPRVLNRVGAFASLIDGRFPDLAHPVLVLKVEEPGSKQLLAAQHGRLPQIGYDLVHHLLNDTVVMGARPLAVLDVIVCGKLEQATVGQLVEVMAKACRDQGCDLVGGETSEQPRVIPAGTYILSAAAVGVVERERVVDGARTIPGDVILAVASNGIHTNGYSLVRALLEKEPTLAEERVGSRSFLDAALLPHLCYNQALQELFARALPHGLAHITGGGIEGNLIRVLPPSARAVIDLSLVRVLPIFSLIKSVGGVPEEDMRRSFNLGVGVIAVVAGKEVETTIAVLGDHGHTAYPIGRIEEGPRQVKFSGALRW